MAGLIESIAEGLKRDQAFVDEHLPDKAKSFGRNGCGCAIFLPLTLLSTILVPLTNPQYGFALVGCILSLTLFVNCFSKYRGIYKAAENARRARKQEEIDFRQNTQQNLSQIREDTKVIGNTILSLSQDVRKLYQDALVRSVPEADKLPRDAPCDFFICHASEDKDEIVRDIARELQQLGAVVFYDEWSLRVGDKLAERLDGGLVSSKFGIVVLSEHFFQKGWTKHELGGLVALETAGRIRILPIWHKVSKDEVIAFSPTIADKVALSTAILTAREIATDLYSLLNK